METRFQESPFTSQLVVGSLLLAFIGLSAFAMFTTSQVGDEMNWLGMTVKRLDAETQAAHGIPANVGGVVVEGVEGIAGQAGVRQGDVVIGINGNGVRDLYDFSHFTGEADVTRGGAQIDVIRNGARLPVFVFPSDAMARTPAQVVPAPGGVVGPQFAISPQWLGIEGDTVRAADAFELGLPVGTQGVVIDAVAIGSRAQLAGLARRDVVVAVNGQRISSARSLWNALGSLSTADPVQLGIYRNGQLVSAIVPTAAATADPAVVAAGGFAGRMGGAGLGPGGLLVCPKCGMTVARPPGVPCFTVACTSCGTMMTRTQ